MKVIANIFAVEVDISEYDVRKEIDELKADISKGIRAFMRDMYPNVNVSVDHIMIADSSENINLLKQEAKFWNKCIRDRFSTAMSEIEDHVRFHSEQTHKLAQVAREMDNEFFPDGSVGIIRCKGYYSVAETIMTDEVWKGICKNPIEYCLVEMTCTER